MTSEWRAPARGPLVTFTVILFTVVHCFDSIRVGVVSRIDAIEAGA